MKPSTEGSKTDMNETIGNRISKYRKEKGLTQEGLAEKLGVSSQAVSKWENDQSCPDIGLLSDLARILGIISPKIKITTVTRIVEIVDANATLSRKRLITISVVHVEIAIFARLLPIRIAESEVVNLQQIS